MELRPLPRKALLPPADPASSVLGTAGGIYRVSVAGASLGTQGRVGSRVSGRPTKLVFPVSEGSIRLYETYLIFAMAKHAADETSGRRILRFSWENEACNASPLSGTCV